MKAHSVSRFVGMVSGAFVIALTPAAEANFFVDYHGVQRKKVSAEILRGHVHEIGNGSASKTSSFGADMPLKDAVSMLMPDKWIAYIDANVDSPALVAWQAKNQPWTVVLGEMGTNFGYRFIVDWDQKLLQISSDQGFKSPEYNDPIALTEPGSGKTVFIYSATPIRENGVFVVNGESSHVESPATKPPADKVSSGELSDRAFRALLNELYQADEE